MNRPAAAPSPLPMVDELLMVLTTWAASPWFPPVVLVIAALDALVPVVPSETLVIVGGAAAAFGDQQVLVIVVCAAVGAFVGDATSYAVGRSAGGALWRRAGPRNRRRLNWAGAQLERRGDMFIVTARFVPGGRTAVTLVSGLTGQPRRRFLRAVALAVVAWASYGAGIGFLFGAAFADDHVRALLWALVTAAALGVVFEVVRRVRERRAVPEHDRTGHI